MTYIPGTHTATILLDRGLPIAAVVLGLVNQIGLSPDQAERATAAAQLGRP